MHLATGFSIPDLASIELVKAHDRNGWILCRLCPGHIGLLGCSSPINSTRMTHCMTTCQRRHRPSRRTETITLRLPYCPYILSRTNPIAAVTVIDKVSPTRRSARLIIPHGKWTLRLTSKLPLNPIKHFLSDLLNAAFHSMVRNRKKAV